MCDAVSIIPTQQAINASASSPFSHLIRMQFKKGEFSTVLQSTSSVVGKWKINKRRLSRLEIGQEQTHCHLNTEMEFRDERNSPSFSLSRPFSISPYSILLNRFHVALSSAHTSRNVNEPYFLSKQTLQRIPTCLMTVYSSSYGNGDFPHSTSPSISAMNLQE